MPRFKLAAQVTVSAYTMVEAKTVQEAIRIAEQRDTAISGRGHTQNEFWIVEEADGMPENIHSAEDD